MYRPAAMAQLTSAFYLLEPTTESVNGVAKKKYTKDYNIQKCSFKSYGGTERVVNNLITIEDTAVVNCWYNPKIKSGCRIERVPDGAIFDIINEPENIEMRNFYMQFKVRRVKGGV